MPDFATGYTGLREQCKDKVPAGTQAHNLTPGGVYVLNIYFCASLAGKCGRFERKHNFNSLKHYGH